MNNVVLIRQSSTVENYFQNFENLFNRKIKVVSAEEDGSNSSDLYFVEYQEGDTFQSVVKTIGARIFVVVDYSALSAKQQKEFKTVLEGFKDNIEGWIDCSKDLEYYYSQINSFFKRQKVVSQLAQMTEMGKSLNEVVENTFSELQRVKKLHEQLVPIRKEEVKGIQVLSKYAAGEKSGGDFFDVIANDNELILLLTSSTSYLTSSMVLTHIQQLRGAAKCGMKEIEKFLSGICTEVREMRDEKDDSVEFLEMFVARLDLKTMSLAGYHFGGAELFSSEGKYIAGNKHLTDRMFFDSAAFDLKLERGQHLVITSSGLEKNSGGMIDGAPLASYIGNQSKGKELQNFINELFFQLKRKRDSQFLKYDTTIITIKVDTNVFVQV